MCSAVLLLQCVLRSDDIIKHIRSQTTVYKTCENIKLKDYFHKHFNLGSPHIQIIVTKILLRFKNIIFS